MKIKINTFYFIHLPQTCTYKNNNDRCILSINLVILRAPSLSEKQLFSIEYIFKSILSAFKKFSSISISSFYFYFLFPSKVSLNGSITLHFTVTTDLNIKKASNRNINVKFYFRSNVMTSNILKAYKIIFSVCSIVIGHMHRTSKLITAPHNIFFLCLFQIISIDFETICIRFKII